MKGFQVECLDDFSTNTARHRFLVVGTNYQLAYVSIQSRELNGKEIAGMKELAHLSASEIAASYRCFEHKALGVHVIANIADFSKFDTFEEMADIYNAVEMQIHNQINYTRLARYIRVAGIAYHA